MKLPLGILALAAILNTGVDASRVRRISGGTKIDITSAPYAAMIRDYAAGTANRGHLCGGTIISNIHILTAAHCISEGDKHPLDLDELDNMIIVVGEQIYDRYSRMYEIDEIYLHPNFHGDIDDISRDRADIAVIKLVHEIEIKLYQKPIELASDDPSPSSVGMVYGWGSTFRNGPNSPSLQGIPVVTFSMAACSWTFPFLGVTKDEICARSAPGQDSCSGDSGGPLVVNNQLAGVNSHGSSKCDGVRPSVFVNVAYFKSWIEDAMKGKVKAIYPPPESSPPAEPYACPAQPSSVPPRRRYSWPLERRRNKARSCSTKPKPNQYM